MPEKLNPIDLLDGRKWCWRELETTMEGEKVPRRFFGMISMSQTIRVLGDRESNFITQDLSELLFYRCQKIRLWYANTSL